MCGKVRRLRYAVAMPWHWHPEVVTAVALQPQLPGAELDIPRGTCMCSSHWIDCAPLGELYLELSNKAVLAQIPQTILLLLLSGLNSAASCSI